MNPPLAAHGRDRILSMLAFALLLAAAGRAGATNITASPVDFSANEGSSFNGAVATFTDDNPAATPADFTASIDWGDGSAVTVGTIGSSSAAFVVSGQHTYPDEGTFTATVTIADVSPGTGTATATDTATITEGDSLTGSPVSFSAPSGVSFTTTVATFTDTLTTNVSTDFTATINWGDATTSAGAVSGGGGSFQVSGTHTYAGAGTFTVMVTLSDDAPGTATDTVSSTAHVSASALAVTATNISATEGAAFNKQVASFSDSNTSLTPGSFTASIDWGDGTAPAPGTIAGGSGSFTVSGPHTYIDEGTFTLKVMVAENSPGTASGSGMATATVGEADALAGSPVTFAAQQGVPFTGAVATFTDTYTANLPSDFVATINWGDSTTSAGIVSGGGGSFTVSGTHTYSASGTLPVTVTLTDDAPGTATATANSSARISAAIAAVPALDFYGLLALGLLLGGAALYLLRARPLTR